SNAAEGRDEEFNSWYNSVHLNEVLEILGFVGAERFELQPTENDVMKHRYLAIYEIEADDPAIPLGELMERASDGRLNMSDSLGDVETRLYRSITSYREA